MLMMIKTSPAVIFSAIFFMTLNATGVEADNYGAPIIDRSVRVQDQKPRHESQEGARFISPRSFDETVKFYKKLWKGNTNFEFRKIAAPAEVRALHIENMNPSSSWEGINIYEHHGETRVFVLQRINKPGKNP